MIELLTRIFLSTMHQQSSNLVDVIHFYKEKQAHYFVLDVEEKELSDLRSVSTFRTENEKYKQFKEGFDKFVKLKSGEAEKNSSLIITVKVDSLNKLDEYKQQILLMEEDESFFKKYVVLYSEKALQQFDSETKIEDYQERILNKNSFENYYHKGYSESIEEYVFLLQLYIKLPILRLKSGGESFMSLESRLKESLGKGKFDIFDRVTESSNMILSYDFESGEENELNDILKFLRDD